MKTTLIALILTTGMMALHAQAANNCGIIKYKDLVKADFHVEGNANDFSHLLPKEIKSEKELIFRDEATLYKASPAEAVADETMGGEEVMIRISTSSPDDMVYTDFASGRTIEKKEFMTRVFLIEGDLEKQDWKITGNQKMILDLPSQEAVTEIDSMQVTAWFTPVIPVPAGPGKFNGLPGLILEVNVDNGQHKILAEEIELGEIPEMHIEKPRKGKKVTEMEFDRIVAEKMEEMGGQTGGGKMMMIEIIQE